MMRNVTSSNSTRCIAAIVGVGPNSAPPSVGSSLTKDTPSPSSPETLVFFLYHHHHHHSLPSSYSGDLSRVFRRLQQHSSIDMRPLHHRMVEPLLPPQSISFSSSFTMLQLAKKRHPDANMQQAMHVNASISTGMKGATKEMVAMNKRPCSWFCQNANQTPRLLIFVRKEIHISESKLVICTRM